jgi:hypothetical protein
MNKKAQAAMEFLTTYGWAILILGVVLAGLGYLGVFNPSSYIKSSCQLDAGLACPVFSAFYDNNTSLSYIDMAVQNNLNDRVEITNLSLSTPQGDDFCESNTSMLLDVGGVPVLASYGSNQQQDIRFTFTSCSLLKSNIGSKQRYNIKIYYKKGDATMPSVTGGKLITVVEQKTAY